MRKKFSIFLRNYIIILSVLLYSCMKKVCLWKKFVYDVFFCFFGLLYLLLVLEWCLLGLNKKWKVN